MPTVRQSNVEPPTSQMTVRSQAAVADELAPRRQDDNKLAKTFEVWHL